MPSPDDLRATLRELADSARDVPDMPLTRGAPRHPSRSSRPVLLTAAVAGVLLVAGVAVSRHDVLPFDPAGGPTQAVPPVATPSPSTGPARPTPTPGGETTTRPMTAAEITTQVEGCLRPGNGLEGHRQGELAVRYAMVQPALGWPGDTTPRTALLLEDAEGYFDCSGGHPTYTSKGGDSVHVDPAAAGSELPTVSGTSSASCTLPAGTAVVEGVVALETSAGAREARVTIRTTEGTRTATAPSRDGFVYTATQVVGEAAWEPSTVTVELLDADGRRLPVQPYAAPATDRLTYPLDPCTTGG